MYIYVFRLKSGTGLGWKSLNAPLPCAPLCGANSFSNILYKTIPLSLFSGLKNEDTAHGIFFEFNAEVCLNIQFPKPSHLRMKIEKGLQCWQGL